MNLALTKGINHHQMATKTGGSSSWLGLYCSHFSISLYFLIKINVTERKFRNSLEKFRNSSQENLTTEVLLLISTKLSKAHMNSQYNKKKFQ